MSRFGQYGYDPLLVEAPEAGAEEPQPPRQKLPPARAAPPVSQAILRAQDAASVERKPAPAAEPFVWELVNTFLAALRLVLLFIGAIPLFLYVFDANVKQFFRSIWLGISARIKPVAFIVFLFHTALGLG